MFESVKSCSFFFEFVGQDVSVARAGLLADAKLTGFVAGRAGVASEEQGDAMRLGRKAALAVGSGALVAAFGGLAGCRCLHTISWRKEAMTQRSMQTDLECAPFLVRLLARSPQRL